MACFQPLAAYKALNIFTESGKNRIIVVGKKEKNKYEGSEEYQYLDLPCGQCIGCRLDRSKSWAIRCVHEASQFHENCFITLTFDDEHINSKGTLVKSDFQKFMKRLRKKFKGKDAVQNDTKISYPIRFFHCGEYGSLLQRPHHHACIFNFDFDDKILWTVRDGVRLYRSPELEKLWPYGFCTVGDVTFQSAAYVARYITKKINGEYAPDHYAVINEETGEGYYLEPEYTTMSRRPGIGRAFYEKYKKQIYQNDFITHEGKKFKSGRYYDKIYDVDNHKDMEAIKRQRIINAKAHADNNTLERLVAREKCQKASAKSLKRGLEL